MGRLDPHRRSGALVDQKLSPRLVAALALVDQIEHLDLQRPVGTDGDLGPLVRLGLLVEHPVELLDLPALEQFATPAGTDQLLDFAAADVLGAPCAGAEPQEAVSGTPGAAGSVLPYTRNKYDEPETDESG